MLSRIQNKKESSRAFFDVVEQNDRYNGLFDLVISTHCDPRYIRNEQQQTLLHVACELNSHDAIDMVRFLVEIYQCDPLVTDSMSRTAYHCACFSGNLEVLSYLFRCSDHHYITDRLPLPWRSDLCGALISSASHSESVEILRFLFHLKFHGRSPLPLKLSLYKDILTVSCKMANCHLLQSKHCWSWRHTTLYEVCSLDALKFFLDELTVEFQSGPLLPRKDEKQVCASLLEVAYKLHKFETIQYLTISKGTSPLQTMCTPPCVCDIDISSIRKSLARNVFQAQVSPLHIAVRSGDIHTVRGLFSQGHHLYCNTDTLLHSACISGNKEMVAVLIDSLKFNIEHFVNAFDINKCTPLHVACEWGHLEVCLLLLKQKGCNINAINVRGHTPLSLAVRHNRLEIFQSLLKKGASILVATNDTLETPLHFACCSVNSQFAKSLLGSKTCTPEYINASDIFGDSALFNACRTKNLETIRVLVLNSGCNRSFINEITKETPAHVASRINSLEVLQALVSEGLEDHMQYPQRNHLDQSLLHLACENDAAEIVDYLIDNKICEQNCFDCYGWTPLHIACMRGNTRIVKKLLTCENFKITDKDKEENTVLHYICNRGVVDPELVKLCLNSENTSIPMIVEQNKSYYNPLHYVCAGDGTQILHCLLKRSKDNKSFNIALYAPNGDGDTPLHLAFTNRSLTIIKFMLNRTELSEGLAKAICVQNSDKKNVFHCAIDQLRFLVYDANGREVSNFVVAVIDLLLQTINNSILLEEDIVSSLCQKNNEQFTPIQYLIRSDSQDPVQTKKLTILSHLFCKLNPESKQRLFSVTTSDGDTLIHLAVKRKAFDIVKHLVDQKICTFAICNERGESPLHRACLVLSDKSDMSFWLCEHGYDPYLLDKSGNSPLFNAIKSNQPLPEQLFKTTHWKPTSPVLQVQVNSDKALYVEHYRQIMIDFKSLTQCPALQLPLPHCMLLHHRGKIRPEVTDIVISCPDLQDTFGNTILHLCSVLIHGESDFLQTLLGRKDCNVNLTNKEGNTPLHIACATQNQYIVAVLLDNDKCSESLTSQNLHGRTPLFYTKKRDIINCLILNGADPSGVADSDRVKGVNEAFEEVKQKHPLDLTVTALVLGDSQAGKTTLIETLRRAYNWKLVDKPSVGQSESICREERTKGVDILEYKVLNVQNDPRILFYDFAGHTQSFQTTHSVLLQSLLSKSHLSPILFIIVVDVSDEIPKQVRLDQVRYWAEFIGDCQSFITTDEMEVIVIGSHIDKVRDIGKHTSIKESLSKKLLPFEDDTFKLIENPFLLDCRESSASELLRVRGILLRSVKQVKEHAELDNRCHLVFSYLYEHFPDKPVRFQQLRHSFRERKPAGFSTNESVIPFMESKLISLLENLRSRQHIFLIGDTKNEFWILTAKAQKSIFNHVHGHLFANKEDFENHIDIGSNVGVLSSTELKKAFPNKDLEMLQEILEYSELCRKISDERVLQLIEYGTEERIDSKDDQNVHDQQTMLESKPNELQMRDKVEYFFFPGLVKETKKYVLQDRNYTYSSGWTLECIAGASFKAIFLQVLLLRLTFRFATSSEFDKKLHRHCIIWNSGVAWSKEGVEICVEMTNQNQTVIVIVQCLEGAELTAVELRSAVVQEVYRVKAKYAARAKTNEFVICNPKFNGDGLLVEPVHKVAMKILALAIKNGSPYVRDTCEYQHHINKDMLCFESYTGVSSDVVSILLDSSKASTTVPEETCRNIAASLKNTGAHPLHIEHIMQLIQDNEPIDYHNLRDYFDKYSLFRGRNPKDLCQ